MKPKASESGRLLRSQLEPVQLRAAHDGTIGLGEERTQTPCIVVEQDSCLRGQLVTHPRSFRWSGHGRPIDETWIRRPAGFHRLRWAQEDQARKRDHTDHGLSCRLGPLRTLVHVKSRLKLQVGKGSYSSRYHGVVHHSIL